MLEEYGENRFSLERCKQCIVIDLPNSFLLSKLFLEPYNLLQISFTELAIEA